MFLTGTLQQVTLGKDVRNLRFVFVSCCGVFVSLKGMCRLSRAKQQLLFRMRGNHMHCDTCVLVMELASRQMMMLCTLQNSGTRQGDVGVDLPRAQKARADALCGFCCCIVIDMFWVKERLLKKYKESCIMHRSDFQFV